MTANEDQSDIIRATARGRFLSVALLALALGTSVLFQFIAMPIVNASLSSNPTPALAHTLKWIFGGFAALAILPSTAMVIIGRKILQAGQYPLPNAWVWRDTAVKRGNRARQMGKLCITSGMFAGIVSLALIAYIWTVFDRISSPPSPRPGITLLQKPIAEKP